jgi:acetyltransferase-like isoleucine patch superfamily enzyme
VGEVPGPTPGVRVWQWPLNRQYACDGPVAFLIRAICVVAHVAVKKLRLIKYQLRAFMWHRPAPWSTSINGRLRFAHLPCRLEIGKNVVLGGEGTYLSTGRDGTIVLGDGVSINRGCVLVASKGITIGKNTAIGEYVSIRDQAHIFVPGKGVRGQGFKVAPVEIGENVWIGRGVFIGPGTRISSDSIVAANSVVHGQFPPGVLLAGAPAVVKKVLVPTQPNAE